MGLRLLVLGLFWGLREGSSSPRRNFHAMMGPVLEPVTHPPAAAARVMLRQSVVPVGLVSIVYESEFSGPSNQDYKYEKKIS